jgi:hypothetical protein
MGEVFSCRDGQHLLETDVEWDVSLAWVVIASAISTVQG